MFIRKYLAGIAAAALAFGGASAAFAAELIQVSPSVWYVQGSRPGAAIASVIVGDKDLVVVDSTCRSDGTAAWLKGELKQRFDKPVKYVILSHDHEDHICGLQVFDDTAISISHENNRAHIVREQRNTTIPSITFSKEASVWLGDKELRLLYFGRTHSDNLIQVYIPSEKILIAPDFMQKGQGLIPDFRDMDVDNMLTTWNYVYRMYDIDWIVNGHGAPSPKSDILNNIEFVSTLRQRVLDEMVKGRSLEEIRAIVTMPEYAHWRGHDRLLDSDIVSMWDYLYSRREPNVGPTHDAWQDVVAKVVDGAAAATTVRSSPQ